VGVRCDSARVLQGRGGGGEVVDGDGRLRGGSDGGGGGGRRHAQLLHNRKLWKEGRRREGCEEGFGGWGGEDRGLRILNLGLAGGERSVREGLGRG